MHALDAKVTLDDNAVFRHPDYVEYDATQVRDPRERFAHERGLQYVGLDGFVGVIANGAGLAMSTVDIVNQVGGSPANFLDIGGGANADVMAGALEVITSDANVRSIFINIFGGITKGEEVANGIVQALDRVKIDPPIVIRLDGTNADEGRAILEPHLSDKLQMEPTMVDRRPSSSSPESRREHAMSIFVDENTKVVYQGLTGGQGKFYGPLNRDYGTQVVGGTNPKKAGTDVDGIPVFATVADAIEATGANASCVFIPAPGVKDAVIEAAEAGIEFIVVHHRGRARARRGVVLQQAPARLPRHAQLLGPNCPGIISPGKCNIGITAGHIAKAGGPVGHREPLRHAHLPGALRAEAEGHRCHDVRRHRWRPRARHELHRLPARVRGRPRDQGRDDDRRDRRLRRGGGGRLHQDHDEQARRRVRRRCHRTAGQEDGPRGRDRVGRQGHRRREDRGAAATPARRSA